jgi:hypothetical protein
MNGYGQQLFSYTVVESGNDTSDHIYPGFSQCTPVGTSNRGNLFDDLRDHTSPAGPEGYLEALGGGGFFYDCHQPGSTAEYSMKNSINSDGWAWSFTTSNLDANHVEPNSFQMSEWPSSYFPGSMLTAVGHTAANGQLDVSSTWDVFFKQLSSDGGGDMGILTMRDTGE